MMPYPLERAHHIRRATSRMKALPSPTDSFGQSAQQKIVISEVGPLESTHFASGIGAAGDWTSPGLVFRGKKLVLQPTLERDPAQPRNMDEKGDLWMNATLTSRGRRLLPLLAICCGLASFPAPAQAGILVSHLTDKATPSQADALAGRTAARVVYQSRREEEETAEEAPHSERPVFGALPALAVILVIPAGTLPVTQPTIGSVPNPPPPPPSSGGSPPPDGGGGHVSGGGGGGPQGSPEPASLILALTGSGMAGLLALARRRRRSTVAAAIPL
jgi:hypothetical protein